MADAMRLHHDAARRAHIGAQVVMQHRRDLPLAQEREIVRVEIVADEYAARPPRRAERLDHCAISPADRIGADDVGIGGERLAHERARRLVDAETLARLDDPEIGVARAERPAESDFTLLLAAKAIAAQRRQDLGLRAAKPFADEIGRRLPGGAVVHADIGRAAAVGHVGDEGDDGDSARNDAIDRRNDLGFVRRFEKKPMRSTRADPVDERGEIGKSHDLTEVVARPEDRRPQCRHLVFERNAHRLGEAVRRLHDDIHDELAPREAGLLALPAQFADRLLDALSGMPAHAAPRVEHPIDGRLAQARLKRDFLDEKRVGHGRTF